MGNTPCSTGNAVTLSPAEISDGLFSPKHVAHASVPALRHTADLGWLLDLFLLSTLIVRLLTYCIMGRPDGSAGRESTCNAGDLGWIPGLGRSPEEGKGYSLQYSGLENSIDCIVHGVKKSQTRLSDFHSLHSRACTPRTSLVVQWLRLQASTAGVQARIPIRELKIPYATQRSPNKQQQQQKP